MWLPVGILAIADTVLLVCYIANISRKSEPNVRPDQMAVVENGVTMNERNEVNADADADVSPNVTLNSFI